MGEELKIIFAGPVGAGKTTAIGAVSDRPPVQTEAAPTDEVRQMKASTTVAMDYGEVQLDEDHHLNLYGLPGQERFSYMWDILARGALGFVVMLNSDADPPATQLGLLETGLGQHLREAPVVVTLTGSRRDEHAVVQETRAALSTMEVFWPVMSISPWKRAEVATVLQVLLAELEFANP